MKTPIFIYEGKTPDLYIFNTVDKAIAYLEPVDVINQEYIGYDGEGRLLRLFVTGDQNSPMYNREVCIEAIEKEPAHASELKKILEKMLPAFGAANSWIAQATFEEMVIKALEYKTG